jgi:hypothetical protein
MSAFRLAAPLIDLAIDDELYALDLDQSIEDDEALRSRLVIDDVPSTEFPYLRPSAWLWYSFWRQRHGGPLPFSLLDYLEKAATSEPYRYRLRLLVLRDRSIQSLDAVDRRDRPSDAERWLRRHINRAVEGPLDPFELQRHLLQIASVASIDALQVLLTTAGQHVATLRTEFLQWFDAIGVDPAQLGSWVEQLSRPPDDDRR